MKVILLQDVKSLGKKGAMVEVNEGYARNFIIPKKLGMEATPKNMNDFKLRKAHEEKVPELLPRILKIKRLFLLLKWERAEEHLAQYPQRRSQMPSRASSARI